MLWFTHYEVNYSVVFHSEIWIDNFSHFNIFLHKVTLDKPGAVLPIDSPGSSGLNIKTYVTGTSLMFLVITFGRREMEPSVWSQCICCIIKAHRYATWPI